MADSNYFDVISSSDQIAKNHEAFKDKYVDSDTQNIDQNTFLKLLVAEMSNQDPLEPTSNTEFISQLAQFSAMGYMQTTGKFTQANYAASLVGKTVSVSKLEGKDWVVVTGVAEKISKNKDDTYSVYINGEQYSLDSVSSVSETAPKKDDDTETPEIPSNSLGDSISKAAAMVGMYATVKTEVSVDKGFIEAIQVQDGKINVVVNGTARPIENILEVTIAYVVDDPEDPENPEAPGEDSDETVSGAGSTENGGSEAAAAGHSLSAEDIPDLSDNEDEALEQLRQIIGSMS